jgi:hypothetical protein
MEAVKPIPSAAELEAQEKERVHALKEYRKNKPKVWYLK